MAALVISGFAAGVYLYNRLTATPESDSACTLQRRSRTTRRPPVIPQDCRIAATNEECVVCTNEPPYFPKDPPSATCTHPSQLCLECLRQTIDAVVASGTFAGDNGGIKCPSLNCQEYMQHTDVRRWAEQDTFQRYDRAVVASALRADPDFVRCLNPRCDAGQIHTGGDDTPMVICYACKSKQCRRHQMVWHTDYTCKQWDKVNKRNRKTDALSINAINSLTKACPGPNCGKRLMKSSGCDHFQCQRPAGCGHQFCWLCLAPWGPIKRGDNSMHYDNCRYYSGKSGAHPSPFRERRKRWFFLWMR